MEVDRCREQSEQRHDVFHAHGVDAPLGLVDQTGRQELFEVVEQLARSWLIEPLRECGRGQVAVDQLADDPYAVELPSAAHTAAAVASDSARIASAVRTIVHETGLLP